LDGLLQSESAAQEGQPGELERHPRSMEEKTCPSQENTLSKVHRNRQAVAQNLRVRTRPTRPERDPFPTRQDQKNNPLRVPCSRLVLCEAFLDELRHERGGQRLVRREMDRGTVDIEPLQLSISGLCELGNPCWNSSHRTSNGSLLRRSRLGDDLGI